MTSRFKLVALYSGYFVQGAHAGPLFHWSRLAVAFELSNASHTGSVLLEAGVATTFFAQGAWRLAPCKWRLAVRNKVWHATGKPDSKVCQRWAQAWDLTKELSKGYALAPLLGWMNSMAVTGTLVSPSLHEVLAATLAAELCMRMLHHYKTAMPAEHKAAPGTNNNNDNNVDNGNSGNSGNCDNSKNNGDNGINKKSDADKARPPD